jgi:hypothetical protein
VRRFPRRYTPRDIAALIDGGTKALPLARGGLAMAVFSVDLLARAMMTTMPMNAIPQSLNLRVWMPMVPAPRIPRARVSYKQPVRQYYRRVKEKRPARAKGVHTQTQKSKAAEC